MQQIVIYWQTVVSQHVSGIFMPIIRRSDCVSLPIVACQATFSTQCTHLATRLSSITTATTGQTTIGSGTQSDLLMMGVKIPETC